MIEYVFEITLFLLCSQNHVVLIYNNVINCQLFSASLFLIKKTGAHLNNMRRRKSYYFSESKVECFI